LDYWPKLKVHIHEDFTAFRTSHPKAKMAFYSSKGTQNYWDLETQEDHYFVFGCESKGLSEALLETQQQSLYKIPLAMDSIRSFNLANAVSIVLFEGKRQQFFKQK
jgi:tRNA (cytidine/uridine-2'-O-)-methyltransferase